MDIGWEGERTGTVQDMGGAIKTINISRRIASFSLGTEGICPEEEVGRYIQVGPAFSMLLIRLQFF